MNANHSPIPTRSKIIVVRISEQAIYWIRSAFSFLAELAFFDQEALKNFADFASVSKYRHVVSTSGRCPGLEARLRLPEASSPKHLALRGCKVEGVATRQWHEPCSPLQSSLSKSAFKRARHVCSSSKVERLLSRIGL